MKLLSLFSGIGAFEKALDRLEVPYELVAYCEIDKYASKSYSAIHGVPESMNIGDITKIDEKKLPKDIDLITYGFPCQDISLAGKQKGLFNEDGTQTRSGLFFEALRIIEETKPKVAIAENVKNLVSKKFSEQFKIVLDSLEQAGYNNHYKVLNSRDFGIPQNRERVFIVSIRKDIDTGVFEFPEPYELKLRLKDLLEDEVDEKFYLNTKGTSGIIKALTDGREHKPNIMSKDTEYSPTIDTRVGSQTHRSPYIEEPQVKQVGQLYGTEKEPNPSGGRVYDSEGILRTLGAGHGKSQPIVMVRTNNKKGYDIAEPGDYINIERPGSTTRRGRVGHGVSQCLDTKENHCVVTKVGNVYPSGGQNGNVYDANGISPTLLSGETNTKGNGGVGSCNAPKVLTHEPITEDFVLSGNNFNQRKVVHHEDGICRTITGQGHSDTEPKVLQHNLRIRKLTPKECFRLMGFNDEDFEQAEKVNSNTQLYKQAGNSIVVDVLEHIFKELFASGAFGGEPKQTENELAIGQLSFADNLSFERYINNCMKKSEGEE